jgi:polar amino acid transport system substrate-binding protein
MKKFAAVAVGMMLTVLATSGVQAQSALKIPNGALLTDGTLALAADFAAAPNQFIKTDGEKDGLNVDMCGEVAKRLNVKLEWTNLSFPGLVPGLQAQRFDGLCTAIFINPDRLKIMNMVPYVQWGEGLMVPKNSSLGSSCSFKAADKASYAGCFDDLAGKAVSVAAAGTTNKNLQAESDRMKAAGKAPIEIRAFDTNADAIQAVVSGQTVAAYLNDPQAAFFINRTNDNFKLAFTGYASNQLALTTMKPNTALADAFVAALEQMKADGTYDAILKKWGVASVPSFAYAK